nr:MAG TPA: Single stranded DNA binding protein [Caudoviricetes sp.]
MLNKVTFQGRFTADPVMKQTPGGVSYCNFDVAWSEKYKEVESTCFLKCRAWRTTAEFLPKYFHKGDQVIVEGRLITNSWTDDQGQKHSTIICDVDKCHFCGAKGGTQGAGNYQVGNYTTQARATATDVPDVSQDVPNFEVLPEGDVLPF